MLFNQPSRHRQRTRRCGVHKLSYLKRCPPGSFYRHLLTEAGLPPPNANRH